MKFGSPISTTASATPHVTVRTPAAVSTSIGVAALRVSGVAEIGRRGTASRCPTSPPPSRRRSSGRTGRRRPPPRATRIRPSAPTPVHRSHSAGTSSSPARTSSSSTIRKSFPDASYLVSRSSAVTRASRNRRRSSLTSTAPASPASNHTHARVPAEPRHLPAGELPRALHRPLDRLIELELTGEVLRDLRVADRLRGGEPVAEPSVDERPDLLDPAGVEHRADPPADPRRRAPRGRSAPPPTRTSEGS